MKCREEVFFLLFSRSGRNFGLELAFGVFFKSK
jgi:hypothetical protein